MRIAYIAYSSFSEENGVPKKIIGQVNALLKLGASCKLFLMDPTGHNDNTYDNKMIQVISKPPGLSKSLWSLFSVKKINEHLGVFRPNIIYLRYPLYRPFLMRVLKSHSPVVVELNSKPIEELKLLGRNRIALWEDWFGSIGLRSVDGIVGVTKEIVQSELQRIGKNIPWIYVGNGIDTSAITPIGFQGKKTNKYRFVFMGASTPWHGIDRLVNMMHQDDRFELRWIGVGQEVISNKLYANNVIAEGFITSDKRISSILSECDVAIGSLALHRKNLREATTLKVREYLAYGMPTIIGYNDTDITDGFPFILKVPPNDDPLDKIKVLEFIRLLRENPQLNLLARQFAVENLDHLPKMREILKFLEKILISLSS